MYSLTNPIFLEIMGFVREIVQKITLAPLMRVGTLLQWEILDLSCLGTDGNEMVSIGNTVSRGSRGGPRGLGPPLDPRFSGPKIEHFWALFNFSIIFFCLASLGILFL